MKSNSIINQSLLVYVYGDQRFKGEANVLPSLLSCWNLCNCCFVFLQLLARINCWCRLCVVWRLWLSSIWFLCLWNLLVLQLSSVEVVSSLNLLRILSLPQFLKSIAQRTKYNSNASTGATTKFFRSNLEIFLPNAKTWPNIATLAASNCPGFAGILFLISRHSFFLLLSSILNLVEWF